MKGGTLIICHIALLGQWKDELETHSKPDSISVFVFFGEDRSSDPRVIAEPDVILTTYDFLTAACKNDGENSIFHRVDWYRVVLDEAHTIKPSKTLGAQAAFKLSSYCRWCLTGTPLQKPYESGDYRGIKLIKAIWRPLKLYYLHTEGNMVICYIKPSPSRFRLTRYVAHEIITTYG